MAVASIAFLDVGKGRNGVETPAAIAETIVSQDVTLSASSQSFGPGNKPFVRVQTEVAIWVAFGAVPDATVAGTRVRVNAGDTEYFAVATPDTTKVAVVTA